MSSNERDTVQMESPTRRQFRLLSSSGGAAVLRTTNMGASASVAASEDAIEAIGARSPGWPSTSRKRISIRVVGSPLAYFMSNVLPWERSGADRQTCIESD